MTSPPRPPRADAVLAAVLTAALLGQVLALDGVSWHLALALAMGVPLAWRSVQPGPVAVIGTLALGIDQLTGGPLIDGAVAFIPLLVATYSVALHEDGRRLAVWGGVLFGLFVLLASAGDDGNVVDGIAFAVLIVFGPAFLAGRLVRSRSRVGAELAARAAELEAEREGHAERAATAERTRLAGELHDVVAHGVAAMLEHVDEARRLVAAGAPEAPAAIAAIEETGRDALGEMRRLLGVLRRGDEDLALTPQPSLARLEALLQRLRDEGRAVDLRVDGTPVALTPGLDVAAYRVVEEALAVVDDADVTLRWLSGRVALEVGSPGPALADPATVASLRERVRLFDGELRTDRRGEGGSALRAVLPVTGAAR